MEDNIKRNTIYQKVKIDQKLHPPRPPMVLLLQQQGYQCYTDYCNLIKSSVNPLSIPIYHKPGAAIRENRPQVLLKILVYLLLLCSINDD